MSHASLHRATPAWILLSALALAGAAVIGCARAEAAQSSNTAAEAQSAHWVQRKFQFTYLGFTTKYSCYGLRDQVANVLVQLGARAKDLKVHPIGCVHGLGKPEPAPSVMGTFYVLEPLSGPKPKHAGTKVVPAHWSTVDVRLASSTLEQAGQCELMEQIKHKILPLFAHRDVQYTSNCMPHQLALPGALLRVKVLKADHKSSDVARTH